MGKSLSLLELCQRRGGACSSHSKPPPQHARAQAGRGTGPRAQDPGRSISMSSCKRSCVVRCASVNHALQRRVLGSTNAPSLQKCSWQFGQEKLKASARSLDQKFRAEALSLGRSASLGRKRNAAPRGSSYAHRGVRGYMTRDATQIINIISLHTHTGSTSKSNLHSV
jgi:hypothetical protein